MYTFRPYTERIARMREKVRDRMIIADAVKDRLQLEASRLYRDFPPILKRAYSSRYVIERMPINIPEDEYFVGDMGTKHWGDAKGMFWLMADIENTWPIGEAGLHHAPDDDPLYSHQPLAISPEDLKELRAIADERMASNGYVIPEEWLPKGAKEFFALQASDYGKIGGWPVMLPPAILPPASRTS
jgi:hypothetical protein